MKNSDRRPGDRSRRRLKAQSPRAVVHAPHTGTTPGRRSEPDFETSKRWAADYMAVQQKQKTSPVCHQRSGRITMTPEAFETLVAWLYHCGRMAL